MWLITVYEDLSMDIKTDDAMSSSPRQLYQKWNFSQCQRCFALPWAFTALVQWKKSQLSWFRRPLFLCIGGGEDGAEYKLLQGYCPNSSLSVLHTPSSATLLAGWGMGSNGAQQDKRGEGGPVTDPSHFPSIRKRLALFEHVFRRPLSHHALGDSTDSFVSKDVDAEEEERPDFALKLPFLTPQKLKWPFTMESVYTDIIWLNDWSYYCVITITYYSQHQSLHNRRAICLISRDSPLALISLNKPTPPCNWIIMESFISVFSLIRIHTTSGWLLRDPDSTRSLKPNNGMQTCHYIAK